MYAILSEKQDCSFSADDGGILDAQANGRDLGDCALWQRPGASDLLTITQLYINVRHGIHTLYISVTSFKTFISQVNTLSNVGLKREWEWMNLTHGKWNFM
jgi:hypothetical protein